MRQGSASLQLVLSLLGALALFAGGLAFAAFGMLQVFSAQPDVDPAPPFLWAGSLAFAGLLVLPSAYYSIQSVRSRPVKLASDSKWITGLALVLFLAVLPLVLLLGNSISPNPHIAWFLLPPLHVLAVAIPVFLISSIALRNLPVGSPRRFWGVFAAALTIGPFSILVVELLAMVAAAGIALFILSSQPATAKVLEELFRNFQYTMPDERALIEMLKPLLNNPTPVVAVVSFVAIIVPMIEETLKPIGLWLLARKTLAPVEGFALGALSGTAYALFESLFLAVSGEAWSSIVIARIGTAALHILTTSLTGWGLALAWGQKKYSRLALLYGLAVFLHASWNALTALNTAAVLLPQDSANPANGLIQSIGKIAPFGLVVLFLGCFIALLLLNRRHAAAAGSALPSADVLPAQTETIPAESAPADQATAESKSASADFDQSPNSKVNTSNGTDSVSD